MAVFEVGERVRGIGVNTGAAYEGTVVPRGNNPRGDARIKITRNLSAPNVGSNPGQYANLINVKRIEDMTYTTNLIGPKPEPVKAPKFVAPFQSDASSVVDANGKVVIKVRQGGYTAGSFALDLSMSERYDMAAVIAEALTEKFAPKVKDAPSPF